MSAGQAHVFYPEARRAALHRRAAAGGRPDRAGPRAPAVRDGGPEAFSLAEYVNDRPYAASSMLAVALGKVFRTAMAGRCDARPELAARPLPLEIQHPGAALPGRHRPGGPAVRAAGLGRAGHAGSRSTRSCRSGAARATSTSGWPGRPGWPTRSATCTCCCRCWTTASTTGSSNDEVDKLLRAGGDWLAAHPERELITRRYLAHQRTSR